MTLGRFDRAEHDLEEVLRSAAGTPAADEAATLLRELLARSAATCDDRPEALLERLAQLSTTPPRAADICSNSGGSSPIERPSKRPLPPHASWPVEYRYDARIRRRSVSQSGAPRPGRRSHQTPDRRRRACPAGVRTATSRRSGSGPGARNVGLVRRLIRVGDDSGPAHEARLQLANLLIDQQRFQEAETLLLTCRKSPLMAIAGRATRMLADLWARQGLYHDAALLMAELGTKFADVQVARNSGGRRGWPRFRATSAAYEAYRRLAPPVWPAAGVTIVENRVSNEALQAIYNGNGVQNLTTPRHSPFDLFDKGRGAAGVVQHRRSPHRSGIRRNNSCPRPVFLPGQRQGGYLQHSHVGQFVPLGGTGALHGLSLLERKLLWTTIPPELSGLKEVVRVGPAGTGFCTFQYRQHLFVLDPADGQVLWHRDDLEAVSGLMSEPYLGIIGDDAVLVVFASNGANYTVYDTASGAELRRGKLDILTSRLPRRAMGRHLFHYTTAVDARRLRVWDPVTDRFVWDQPAEQIAEASVLEGVAPGTKVFTFVRDTEEAAFVTTAGRIRVVNLVSGEDQFDVAIAPEQCENLCYLRAFRDRDRYYFNLQRSWPPGKAPAIPGYLVSDASLPCVHIQGELCAVDVATKRVLWQRTLGNRSILNLPDLPLPVLVSLCRIRSQDQSSLAVEVLDIETGETLSNREDILSDRLLQAWYDRKAGLIELRGAKTAIRLEFPTNVARLDSAEPPR